MSIADTSSVRPRVEPVLVTLPDSCRLAARLFGSEGAPSVLFVAGGDGTMLQWRGLIPDLCVDDAERELFAAAGCRVSLADGLWVAVYDARGCGWSSRSHGVCSTPGVAAGDALALAAALFGGPFHLVGHGVGAAVALELALAAGRLVRSLTLISALVGGDGSRSAGGMRARRAADGAACAEDGVAREAGVVRAEDRVARAGDDVSRCFAPAFAAAHPELVAHIAAEARDTARGEAELVRHGFNGMTAAEARAELLASLDVRARLGDVTAPTLVIHGEHDAVVPPGDGQALTEGIPGARLLSLDAGHAVTIERADDVAAAIGAHVLLHP